MKPFELLPPAFSVTALDDQAATVLVVLGEVDSATAPELERAVGRTAGDVVVDLCETRFMDSSGLHALVRAMRDLSGAGRRFAVACVPGGPVQRLMSVAQIGDLLHVFATREAALESLAAPA